MSIESSVIHGNEWWSEKQCPVSKSWTNMPFSRSRRSGPLSRRTPAIDSQHLAKYAPLLEKANSVYNSEPTAFLKSATPTPPPITSKSDGNGLHLLLTLSLGIFFVCNCYNLVIPLERSLNRAFPSTWLLFIALYLFQKCVFYWHGKRERTFNLWRLGWTKWEKIS